MSEKSEGKRPTDVKRKVSQIIRRILDIVEYEGLGVGRTGQSGLSAREMTQDY